MAWEHQIAKALKQQNRKTKEKATSEATVFIGNVEQKNPLIISIEDGQLMFEESEDEIIFTKTFKARTQETSFSAGASVICLPTDGLQRIVAVEVRV